MIVPVCTPPSRIDATNVAEFAWTVSEHVARHGCMVIDCSEVEWITGVGMRVLETAANDASITLVNPNPAVHLMAATFGGDVKCRYDRMPDVSYRRLVAVHTGGRVAS
jgi:anti-anti-sigma regulatory factor